MDLEQGKRWYRAPLAAVLIAAAAGGLAACGETGGDASNNYNGRARPSIRQTPSAPPVGMPTTGQAARLAIEQDWLAVFSTGTAASLREMMLQNGQRYTAALTSRGRSPAAVKVTRVTLGPHQQATVTYQVTGGGKAAAGSRTGTAVYQQGTWKVSDASFCAVSRC